MQNGGPEDAVFALSCFAFLYCVLAKHVQSKSTILEIVALFVCHFINPAVTYFSYFTCKLLMSFLVFLLSLPTNKKKPKLTYHLGFPTDRWHAGVSCGTNFYHYAFPASGPPKPKTDQSWGLVPRDAPKAVGDNATLKTKCGFAYDGADDPAGILQLLESCGRCHNWALITIYEMATDKFLSFSMLSFLRWDVWALVGMSMVFGTKVCFPNGLFGGFRDEIGDLMDVGFLILSVVDGFNMRNARLIANRAHANRDKWRSIKNALKCMCLFFFWYIYVQVIIKAYSVTGLFQFLLLLVLSVGITTMVNLLVGEHNNIRNIK